MAENNSTILKNIWLNGTNDYQQRVPAPDQSDIQATLHFLTQPMNKRYYNEFVDSLVNRIGYTIVRNSKTFDNPLRVFQTTQLSYGSTIQEIATKWIRAHHYADEGNEGDIFKTTRPEALSAFHTINRQDYYPISINEVELRRAFTDEYGLNSFISSVLTVPTNSDNYDEYRIMLNLIAQYQEEHGYFAIHTDTVPDTEEAAKKLLVDIRAYTGKLQFPSSRYINSGFSGLPVFAKPDELVLITTPEIKANIDVRALAAAFNVDYAKVDPRIILVDEFPVPGMYAMLTTNEFFIQANTVFETTSIYDPVGLKTNYFLHHHGVYSVSPFVPVITWTTAAANDNTTVVTQKVTGIKATPESTTVTAGGRVKIGIALQGTITPTTEGVETKPNSVVATSITAATSEGTAVELDNSTYLTGAGYLHVAKSVPTGTVITLNLAATYVNPSGANSTYTTTTNVTVA